MTIKEINEKGIDICVQELIELGEQVEKERKEQSEKIDLITSWEDVDKLMGSNSEQ